MIHQLPDDVVRLLFARKQAVDMADQAKKMADALWIEGLHLVLGTLGIQDGDPYELSFEDGVVTTPHSDLPTNGEEA